MSFASARGDVGWFASAAAFAGRSDSGSSGPARASCAGTLIGGGERRLRSRQTQAPATRSATSGSRRSAAASAATGPAPRLQSRPGSRSVLAGRHPDDASRGQSGFLPALAASEDARQRFRPPQRDLHACAAGLRSGTAIRTPPRRSAELAIHRALVAPGRLARSLRARLAGFLRQPASYPDPEVGRITCA